VGQTHHPRVRGRTHIVKERGESQGNFEIEVGTKRSRRSDPKESLEATGCGQEEWERLSIADGDIIPRPLPNSKSGSTPAREVGHSRSVSLAYNYSFRSLDLVVNRLSGV
jgi:hypothetical protein